MHLQARDNCLNAGQQWMVGCLLKQMGYNINVIDPDEEEPRKKTQEEVKVLKALKEVK